MPGLPRPHSHKPPFAPWSDQTPRSLIVVDCAWLGSSPYTLNAKP